MSILVTLVMVVPWQETEAKEKTLNELKAEAKANRDAYNEAKEQKELTEEEKAEVTVKKKLLKPK